MPDVTVLGGPHDGRVLHLEREPGLGIRIPDPLPIDACTFGPAEPRRRTLVTGETMRTKPNPDYVPPTPLAVGVTHYRVRRDTAGRWYAVHPSVTLGGAG